MPRGGWVERGEQREESWNVVSRSIWQHGKILPPPHLLNPCEEGLVGRQFALYPYESRLCLPLARLILGREKRYQLLLGQMAVGSPPVSAHTPNPCSVRYAWKPKSLLFLFRYLVLFGVLLVLTCQRGVRIDESSCTCKLIAACCNYYSYKEISFSNRAPQKFPYLNTATIKSLDSCFGCSSYILHDWRESLNI